MTDLYSGWARIINWEAAFSTQTTAIEWLAEPMMEKQSSSAIYGPAGCGKSLFMQDIGARIAAGKAVLGTGARPPASVLYLDAENRLDQITGRLRDMGYSPADLGCLHYASFPEIAPLDTQAGGQQLTELIRAFVPVLVVVDTTSRIIVGAESSADTFGDLHRYSLAPLRREGIAVVRIDHEGKDPFRGQRGSSAKGADVDTVWRFTATGDTRLCALEKDRGDGNARTFRVRIERDPLRHEMADAALTVAQAGLRAELDRLGVPGDAGRPACAEAVRAAGLTARNEDLAAVVRFRKEVAATFGDGSTTWDSSWDSSLGQFPGQPGTVDIPAGQSLGQLGDSMSQSLGTVPPLLGGTVSRTGQGQRENGQRGNGTPPSLPPAEDSPQGSAACDDTTADSDDCLECAALGSGQCYRHWLIARYPS